MQRVALPLAILTSFMLAPAVGATSYVDHAQPILGAKCGGCHTTGASGGHSVGTTYGDSQGDAYSCEDSSVAECSVERIADGTMPAGKNCGGVVADDADNADICVTESEFAILEAWIAVGSPEEGLIECESDDDCDEGWVCTDGACDDDGGDVIEPDCTTDEDCGEGEVCDEGDCAVDATFASCESDSDCTEEGFACTDSGICALAPGEGPECVSDSDCAEGQTCPGFECVDAPADDGADDGTGDDEATPADDGGCQTGGGSLGWLMLMLAGLALVATRRRSVFDQ